MSCSGGRLSPVTTEPFRMKLCRRGKTTEDVTPQNKWNLDMELRENHQYLNELKHFCECVRDGNEPIVNGFDGRAAIEIINAAYLSARKNEKIRLPLSDSPDLENILSGIMTAKRPLKGKSNI